MDALNQWSPECVAATRAGTWTYIRNTLALIANGVIQQAHGVAFVLSLCHVPFPESSRAAATTLKSETFERSQKSPGIT